MGNAVVLASAAKDGDIAQLHSLLAQWTGTRQELAAELNTADDQGYNALHYATRYGHHTAIELLLSMSADPNIHDKFGEPPLGTACGYGNMAVCRELLKGNSNPDLCSDFDGGFPLHRAAKNGHVEVIELLARAGARLDVVDDYGRTPLWTGVRSDQVGTVSELLENGASPWIKDSSGRSATVLAKERAALDTAKQETRQIYEIFGARARELRLRTVFQQMQNNTCGKTIDLSNTKLTDPSNLAHLMAALIANTTVEELILDGNTFGCQGVTPLTIALSSNTTLRTLSLMGTRIEMEGTLALVETLANNDTITEVQLDFWSEDVELLYAFTKLNKGLLVFTTALENNELPDADTCSLLLLECATLGKSKWVVELAKYARFDTTTIRCHSLLLQAETPDVYALLAVYSKDCTFEIETRNMLDRDINKMNAIRSVLTLMSKSNWISNSGETVLHRIVVGVLSHGLSEDVAVDFVQAVVSANVGTLGKKDRDGNDALSFAISKGGVRCAKIVAKLTDLTSMQFFSRFRLQDEGHAIKTTPDAVQMLAVDTDNDNTEVVVHLKSRRKGWENEIHRRSMIDRSILDDAVVPVIACAVYTEAVIDSTSHKIVPEASLSKDVMSAFKQELKAAVSLDFLQAVGKRISAASQDGRLIESDLAELRQIYRHRAQQEYSQENRTIGGVAEETVRSMTRISKKVSGFVGDKVKRVTTATATINSDSQVSLDEEDFDLLQRNKLWYAGTLSADVCVAAVSNGQRGDFLVRRVRLNFVIYVKQKGVVIELPINVLDSAETRSSTIQTPATETKTPSTTIPSTTTTPSTTTATTSTSSSPVRVTLASLVRGGGSPAKTIELKPNCDGAIQDTPQQPNEICEVTVDDVGKRVYVDGYEGRGVLRFLGVHAITGTIKCGVEMDAAVGKNNGTLAGHVYFTCDHNKGVLVDPKKVKLVSIKSFSYVVDDCEELRGKIFSSVNDVVVALSSSLPLQSPASSPQQITPTSSVSPPMTTLTTTATTTTGVGPKLLRRAALCPHVMDRSVDTIRCDDVGMLPNFDPFKPIMIRTNVPESILHTLQQKPYIFVMKRESKNLADIIRDEALHLNSGTVLAVVTDLCKCVKTLHDNHIIYGLLAPESVQRTMRRGRAAFRLHGLANAATSEVPCRLDKTGMLKASQYVAPQLLQRLVDNPDADLLLEDSDDLGIPTQVDLWGLACIVYECFVGSPMKKTPRETGDTVQVNWSGLTSRQRNALNMSAGGYPLLDLIDWMTDVDAASRPETIDEVLGHRFFASIGELRKERFWDAVGMHLDNSSVMVEEDPEASTQSLERVAFFFNECDEPLVLPIALEIAPFLSKLWLNFYDPRSPKIARVTEDVLGDCDMAIIFTSSSYCEAPSVWQLVKSLCETNLVVAAVNVDIAAHEWPPQAFRHREQLQTITKPDLINLVTSKTNSRAIDKASSGLRFAEAIEGSEVDAFWIRKMQLMRQALVAREATNVKARDNALELASAVPQLRKDNTLLEKTVKTLQKECQTLLRQESKQDKTLTELQQNCDELGQAYTAVSEETKRLQRENQELREQYTSSEANAITLVDECEELRRQLAALQQSHKEKILEGTSALELLKQKRKSEKEKWDKQRRELEQQLNDAQTAFAEHTSVEKRSTTSETTKLQQQLDSLQKQFNDQAKELQNSQNLCKKWKTRAQKEKLKKTELDGESTTEIQANTLSASSEVLKQLEECKTELEHTKQTMAEMTKNENSMAAASDATNTIATTTTLENMEKTENKNDNKTIDTSADELKHSIADLTTQLEELRLLQRETVKAHKAEITKLNKKSRRITRTGKSGKTGKLGKHNQDDNDDDDNDDINNTNNNENVGSVDDERVAALTLAWEKTKEELSFAQQKLSEAETKIATVATTNNNNNDNNNNNNNDNNNNNNKNNNNDTDNNNNNNNNNNTEDSTTVTSDTTSTAETFFTSESEGVSASNPLATQLQTLTTQLEQARVDAMKSNKEHKSEMAKLRRELRKGNKALAEVNEHKTENQRLKLQLEEDQDTQLHSRNVTLNQTANSSNDDAAILEKKYKAEAAKYKSELQEANEKLTSLTSNSKLNSKLKRVSGNDAELQRLERELDSTNSEVAEWKHRCSELQDKCLALARSHAAIREKTLAGTPSKKSFFGNLLNK